MNIDLRNVCYAKVQDTVTKNDVTLWLKIEENADTQDALVSDNLVKATQNKCNEDELKPLVKNDVKIDDSIPQPVCSMKTIEHFNMMAGRYCSIKPRKECHFAL